MSSVSENAPIKRPIRRLELQIHNFNVAIPYHVDLLQKHKSNIEKYQAQHDWDRMNKEVINVSRLIKQLKELLYQMDTLRSQVLDSDINEFDKLIDKARTSLMNAMAEYFDLEFNLPLSPPESPKSKDQDEDHPLNDRYIQLQEEQEELQQQEACLHTYNNLQQDISELHDMFSDFSKIVDNQKEMVNSAERNVEVANQNVEEGEKMLAKAARYKIAMYPVVGAMIGTCVGGPIGLVAGLKVGGLAALSCGILGFTGAALLKKKMLDNQSSSNSTENPTEQTELLTKPSSSPKRSVETKKDM